MLAEVKVKIGGEEYIVKEVTIGEMLPLMNQMSKDGEAAQQAQLDMLKLCIYKDGKLLGHGVMDLGLQAYLKLVQAAVEVNGLEGKE